MAAAENRLILPEEMQNSTSEQTNQIPEPTPTIPTVRPQGEHTTIPTVRPQGEQTSEYYHTDNIPDRFENPDCFEGYGSQPQNPMYRTTNMTYGNRSPTVHTMPTTFRARSQKFSVHLGTCGMYRNQGLNTALDQSKV